MDIPQSGPVEEAGVSQAINRPITTPPAERSASDTVLGAPYSHQSPRTPLTPASSISNPETSLQSASIRHPTLSLLQGVQSLVPELQLIIIERSVLSRLPCIDFMLYDDCHKPWPEGPGVCSFQHNLDVSLGPFPRTRRVPHTPAKHITEVSEMWLIEANKFFFRHNIFVFNQTGGFQTSAGQRSIYQRAIDNVDNGTEMTMSDWQELRDPAATRLLDFIDRPDWKGKGSISFHHEYRGDRSYKVVDKYRYSIRHLVIGLFHPWAWVIEPDWAWPLKIDWTTLPNLEFLQLDLTTYSRRHVMKILLFEDEVYEQVLEEGAKKLACLKLKKFVLVGLCSFATYFEDAAHKRKMWEMFRPALRQGGELVFKDQAYVESW